MAFLFGHWPAALLFAALGLVTLALLDLKIAPHVTIGRNYLYRWYIIPNNRLLNVYLHKFVGSDDDRALHDRPWPNVSILLKGVYLEHTKHGADFHRAPSIIFRRAGTAHRLELVTKT